MLSYALADGSAGLIRIIQTLSSSPSSSGFTLDYTVVTIVEKSDTPIFQPNNTGITALSWIFPRENVRIAVDVLSLADMTAGGPGADDTRRRVPVVRWSIVLALVRPPRPPSPYAKTVCRFLLPPTCLWHPLRASRRHALCFSLRRLYPRNQIAYRRTRTFQRVSEFG